MKDLGELPVKLSEKWNFAIMSRTTIKLMNKDVRASARAILRSILYELGTLKLVHRARIQKNPLHVRMHQITFLLMLTRVFLPMGAALALSLRRAGSTKLSTFREPDCARRQTRTPGILFPTCGSFCAPGASTTGWGTFSAPGACAR